VIDELLDLIGKTVGERVPMISEPEKEQKPSHASGTKHAYRVEVRCGAHEPRVVQGITLDKEWREIHFPEGVPGVPVGPRFDIPELMSTSTLSYQAAQALRWWFHASVEAEKGLNSVMIDSRIVKYEIKYSREWKRISTHCEIGGDDRSNIMPDYGSPQKAGGERG